MFVRKNNTDAVAHWARDSGASFVGHDRIRLLHGEENDHARNCWRLAVRPYTNSRASDRGRDGRLWSIAEMPTAREGVCLLRCLRRRLPQLPGACNGGTKCRIATAAYAHWLLAAFTQSKMHMSASRSGCRTELVIGGAHWVRQTDVLWPAIGPAMGTPWATLWPGPGGQWAPFARWQPQRTSLCATRWPQTSRYSDHRPGLIALIGSMTPAGFEEFCSELLARVGVEDVQTTRYAGMAA
jgi:hypothetical protein